MGYIGDKKQHCHAPSFPKDTGSLHAVHPAVPQIHIHKYDVVHAAPIGQKGLRPAKGADLESAVMLCAVAGEAFLQIPGIIRVILDNRRKILFHWNPSSPALFILANRKSFVNTLKKYGEMVSVLCTM